tara:strand:- start:320 stop:505 length:186 start_codon:yes stop_codon:yes gene_type:complete
MNIDWDEIILLAQEVDSDDPESLAKLFVDLLQSEYSSRNKKRHNLVSDFTNLIDKEQGVVK